MATLRDTRRSIPVRVVSIALAIAFALATAGVSASLGRPPAHGQNAPGGTTNPSRRMADGKRWTTQNLNVDTVQSFCYGEEESHCRQYGRLYPWDSARRGCQSLGGGWRLPTDDEWRGLAKQYGGIHDDSHDRGKTAYEALLIGGASSFNALLGGGREAAGGQYARREAHGFYWTASEDGPSTAWFYNFGRGSQGLYRQSGGEKQMALSVRCVSSDD